MPDALPDLSVPLPRELAVELLAIARAHGADLAEVYAERSVLSSFGLEEGRIRSSEYALGQGVGVRALWGEQTGYAYADGFAPADLREAARVAGRIARGGAGGLPRAFAVADAPAPFTLAAPVTLALDEAARVGMLRRADAAARGHDARVHDVTATLADSARACVIANSDGLWAEDRHFVARLAVTAYAAEGGVRQQGTASGGGSVEAAYFTDTRTPEQVAREAAGVAVTLLAAEEPEAGTYSVVVGPGWGGVLVHECFGHSMEGDGIRKGSSIRATQLGRQVAAAYHDDAAQRRGHLHPHFPRRPATVDGFGDVDVLQAARFLPARSLPLDDRMGDAPVLQSARRDLRSAFDGGRARQRVASRGRQLW